jgi:hypothetical protein
MESDSWRSAFVPCIIKKPSIILCNRGERASDLRHFFLSLELYTMPITPLDLRETNLLYQSTPIRELCVGQHFFRA